VAHLPSLLSSLFAALLAAIFIPGIAAGALPKWALLSVAALVICFIKTPLDRLTWICLGFLGYLALSLAWSDDPAVGALHLQKWIILFALFQWGRTKPNLHLAGAVAVTVAIAFITLLPEYVGGYGNPNFATEFILGCSPLAVAFTPLMAVPIVLYFCFAETVLQWFAILLSLCAYALQRKHLTFRGVTYKPTNTVLCMVLASFCAAIGIALSLESIRASVFARLEFLLPTLALWWEHPIAGHGLGSFNYEFPRVYGLTQTVLDVPFSMPINYYAGAAHNDLAQLGMETGLIGFGFAGWLIARTEKRGPEWCAVLLLLAASLIGFPLQNPASSAVFAVCLGYVQRPCSSHSWHRFGSKYAHINILQSLKSRQI
jgi:hypothetical protein